MTKDLDFIVADDGGIGGNGRAGYRVMNTKMDFIRANSSGGCGTHAARVADQLDFENNTYIGVYMGRRSSGGYGINIDSVVEYDDKIVVEVTHHTPLPGSMTPCVMTNPYEFVSIKKTDKPIEFDDSTPGPLYFP